MGVKWWLWRQDERRHTPFSVNTESTAKRLVTQEVGRLSPDMRQHAQGCSRIT